MSVYIQNFVKFKPFLKELVSRDVKVKYRRSILGVLWTLLNPLLMMTVLSIVFSNLFKFDIENFPLYLLCGQGLIFNFFNDCYDKCNVSNYRECISDKEGVCTEICIYRLQNHKFLCKYDICSGGTYYRIYRVPGSPECILPVHSGDSFAGISVLPGTGNAVSTGMCILP